MSDGGLPSSPRSLSRSVAPGAGTDRGTGLEKPPSMVLTPACPDTTGVGAAGAGLLAADNRLIHHPASRVHERQ